MTFISSPGFQAYAAFMEKFRAAVGAFLLAFWIAGYSAVFDPYVTDGSLNLFYIVSTLVVLPSFLGLVILSVNAFKSKTSAIGDQKGWKIFRIVLIVWGLATYPAWLLYARFNGIGEPELTTIGWGAIFAVFIYLTLAGVLWTPQKSYQRIVGRISLGTLALYGFFWVGFSLYTSFALKQGIEDHSGGENFTLTTSSGSEAFAGLNDLGSAFPFFFYQHTRSVAHRQATDKPYDLYLSAAKIEPVGWSFRDRQFVPIEH